MECIDIITLARGRREEAGAKDRYGMGTYRTLTHLRGDRYPAPFSYENDKRK